jgi:hypothetical protein
LRSLGRCLAI